MDNPKILVIGDSCNDIFIYGECNRLCPDAPIPVFNPLEEKKTLGMAGNVFKNLEGLKATVHFITNKEEINKTRYVHQRTNQMFLRVDTGEQIIKPLTKERLRLVDWKSYDAVVVSDYNKGFLTENILEYISKQHPLTFIDTKKILNKWVNNFTFIKLNELEFSKSYDLFSRDIEGNSFNGQEIWSPKVIITKGSKGAFFDKKEFPVSKVEIKDTTGAGDTFLASFVYYYCILKQYPDKDPDFGFKYEDIRYSSIRFANFMSTKVVQEKGTSIIKKEWQHEFENPE